MSDAQMAAQRIEQQIGVHLREASTLIVAERIAASAFGDRSPDDPTTPEEWALERARFVRGLAEDIKKLPKQ